MVSRGSTAFRWRRYYNQAHNFTRRNPAVVPGTFLFTLVTLAVIQVLMKSGSTRSLAAAALPQLDLKNEVEFGRQYTIRVNTYRRNDLLKTFLRHFTQCPNVAAIQIIWSDQENPPPAIRTFDLPASNVPVHYERHKVNSLNNRFRAILPIPTKAVLSVDDDMLMSCHNLDMAFEVWRLSPMSLVGFSARLVRERGGQGSWEYSGKSVDVLRGGQYNLVLTKDCFLHRDLLKAYFRLVTPEMQAFIDQHKNCEDIAMQFVASIESNGAPPVWVRARVSDKGRGNGISSGAGHDQVRSECVRKLVGEFGGMPLTNNSFIAASINDYVGPSNEILGMYRRLRTAELHADKGHDVTSDIAAIRQDLAVYLHRWNYVKPKEHSIINSSSSSSNSEEGEAEPASTVRSRKRRPQRVTSTEPQDSGDDSDSTTSEQGEALERR